MSNHIYAASDYAGISTINLKAYYGYEETTENGEWCFKAEFGNEKLIIPFSKLGVNDEFNCKTCLLAGIALLFEKYKLTQ